MQSVFNSLRVMRERGEIAYDLTEKAGGKPVRVYYYKSDLIKKTKDNLFELNQKHKELNEEDVRYFFDLENDLIALLEQIKKVKLKFEGCSFRPLDKYLRKQKITELWNNIKNEV